MNEDDIEIAAQGMLNSKAWPVVFQAGAARELARAAIAAVRDEELARGYRLEQDKTNHFVRS